MLTACLNALPAGHTLHTDTRKRLGRFLHHWGDAIAAAASKKSLASITSAKRNAITTISLQFAAAGDWGVLWRCFLMREAAFPDLAHQPFRAHRILVHCLKVRDGEAWQPGAEVVRLLSETFRHAPPLPTVTVVNPAVDLVKALEEPHRRALFWLPSPQERRAMVPTVGGGAQADETLCPQLLVADLLHLTTCTVQWQWNEAWETLTMGQLLALAQDLAAALWPLYRAVLRSAATVDLRRRILQCMVTAAFGIPEGRTYWRLDVTRITELPRVATLRIIASILRRLDPAVNPAPDVNTQATEGAVGGAERNDDESPGSPGSLAITPATEHKPCRVVVTLLDWQPYRWHPDDLVTIQAFGRRHSLWHLVAHEYGPGYTHVYRAVDAVLFRDKVRDTWTAWDARPDPSQALARSLKGEDKLATEGMVLHERNFRAFLRASAAWRKAGWGMLDNEARNANEEGEEGDDAHTAPRKRQRVVEL